MATTEENNFLLLKHFYIFNSNFLIWEEEQIGQKIILLGIDQKQ